MLVLLLLCAYMPLVPLIMWWYGNMLPCARNSSAGLLLQRRLSRRRLQQGQKWQRRQWHRHLHQVPPRRATTPGGCGGIEVHRS